MIVLGKSTFILYFNLLHTQHSSPSPLKISLSQLSSEFKSIGAPFLMLSPDVLGVGLVKLDGIF